jgi:hypothetical protein
MDWVRELEAADAFAAAREDETRPYDHLYNARNTLTNLLEQVEGFELTEKEGVKREHIVSAHSNAILYALLYMLSSPLAPAGGLLTCSPLCSAVRLSTAWVTSGSTWRSHTRPTNICACAS